MNATANYEVTLIIPVCSLEECLPSLFKALDDYKSKTNLHFCILFVNDASSDKSGALIRDYCMRVNDAFYITLMREAGLTGALKAGLKRTFSPCVAYIDPLMRALPECIDELYAKIPEHGMVVGEREFSNCRKLHHILARFLNYVRRSITHDELHDPSYPAMLMHTDLAKRLPWYSGMHAFTPALVMLNGYRVASVCVKSATKAVFSRRVSWPCEIVRGSADLVIYMWMRCRYTDPAVQEGNLKDFE